ncbi:riboflavin kinase [Candidatus Pacearchaeota archaeon]|nr:riboflavin kinase [Candidatus Pacearchaeota archaeon]
MWLRRKVLQGKKLGRKIGFPTLNFHVGNFGKTYSEGVYACQVQVRKTTYKGALYYGSRLSSRGKVLEVHVLGFNKNIYNQFIQLKVSKKIRGPLLFNNIEALKKQIQEDLLRIVGVKK